MGMDSFIDLKPLQDLVAEIQAAMPVPADAAPVSIADTSAKGVATTKYALQDHTHKSSFQAKRLPVAGGAGKFTWTFDQPFPDGIVPVVIGTGEVVSNATQGVLVNVIESSITNVKADFLIFRTQTQTLPGLALSLLNLVVSTIGLAPNNTYVNCMARMPSLPSS